MRIYQAGVDSKGYLESAKAAEVSQLLMSFAYTRYQAIIKTIIQDEAEAPLDSPENTPE